MDRTEAHPLEVAIVVALVVAEALMVLVIAAVALVLTLAQWRAAPSPANPDKANLPHPVTTVSPKRACFGDTTSTQQPQPHPLALLAMELETLPAVTLRSMAGIRSKRIRKADLIAMVAAMA